MRKGRLLKLIVLLVVAGFCAPGIALELPADARAPSQSQLTTMLSGNSLDGVWAGRAFKQYFESSGSTRYQEHNGRPSNGQWRVSTDGQYCSVWPPSTHETCYQVLVSGRQIFWKSGEEYHPSKIVTGNSFD